jgi:hypothetical protein
MQASAEEFLLNKQGIAFGTKQGGDKVHDVVLPPWASSAQDMAKQVGSPQRMLCPSLAHALRAAGCSGRAKSCGVRACCAAARGARVRLRVSVSFVGRCSAAAPSLVRAFRETAEVSGAAGRRCVQLCAPARVDRPDLRLQAARRGGDRGRQPLRPPHLRGVRSRPKARRPVPPRDVCTQLLRRRGWQIAGTAHQ